MRATMLVVVLGVLLGGGCSPTSKGPLVVPSAAGWTVRHDADGGRSFYTLFSGDVSDGTMTFYEWQANTQAQQIPTMLRQVADGFEAKVTSRGGARFVAMTPTIESFSGSTASGYYVVFQSVDPERDSQVLFFFTVRSNLWSGQFSGPSQRWRHALAVLQGLRSDG